MCQSGTALIPRGICPTSVGRRLNFHKNFRLDVKTKSRSIPLFEKDPENRFLKRKVGVLCEVLLIQASVQREPGPLFALILSALGWPS